MKKKYKILIFTLVLLVATLILNSISLHNKVRKEIIDSSFLLTRKNIVSNDDWITSEYVFNNNDTITFNVTRSDGTFNSYDFGKFKISGKKIIYSNPDYEKGFGAKHKILLFDFEEDAIYEIDQSSKYERRLKTYAELVEELPTTKKVIIRTLSNQKEIKTITDEKMINEIIKVMINGSSVMGTYKTTEGNVYDFAMYDEHDKLISNIYVNNAASRFQVQGIGRYFFSDSSMIREILGITISEDFIDIAYGYLPAETQSIIVDKYDAMASSFITSAGYRVTNQNGELIKVENKEVIAIDFQTNIQNQKPNNIVVIIDSNTKELVGYGILE